MLSKTVSFLLNLLGIFLIIFSLLNFNISSITSIIGLAIGIALLGIGWMAKNLAGK